MDKKTHENLNPIKINTYTMVISTVAHYLIFVSLMASNDVRKETAFCKFSEVTTSIHKVANVQMLFLSYYWNS